jgi:hypothetical protein
MCRGNRSLQLRAATADELRAYPAAALIAMAGLQLVYPPQFASECAAFAWGSVGYIQMCMECLRMLVYLLLGYILPAWLQNLPAFASENYLQALPPEKPLTGAADTGSAGASALMLHIGADPGLWALQQCFECQWQRVCTPPESSTRPQALQGCLRCAASQPPQPLRTSGSTQLQCLAATVVLPPAHTGMAQSCCTCAAAPVTVVGRPLEPDGQGSPPNQQASSSRTTSDMRILVHEDSTRFGTRLHDQASPQWLAQAAEVANDYLAPQRSQIRQLGTFQGLQAGHTDQQQTPSSGRAHVDLRSVDWGSCIQEAFLHQQLSERQGRQALVPGPLGAEPAAFVVPAFAQPPALLALGSKALRECVERRIWAGCHQCNV